MNFAPAFLQPLLLFKVVGQEDSLFGECERHFEWRDASCHAPDSEGLCCERVLYSSARPTFNQEFTARHFVVHWATVTGKNCGIHVGPSGSPFFQILIIDAELRFGAKELSWWPGRLARIRCSRCHLISSFDFNCIARRTLT